MKFPATTLARGTARAVAVATAALLCASAAHAAKPARVVLPHKLVAGQTATLAVLDSDGRLLEGVTVTFTGSAQVTTDETGRAIFTAPGSQGVLFAEAGNTEGSARASAVVNLPPEKPTQGLSVADVPPVISLATEFAVSGFGFRGEADQNDVLLGGKQAIVLAASPSSLVIVPAPDLQPGPTSIRFMVGDATQGPLSMTLVALEVSADPNRVAPKKRGKLTIRARGIAVPVELMVVNHTPQIIELPEGNTKVRVHTSGGAENAVTLEVKGKSEGDFAVEVRLVAAASGMPDTVLAHRELTAARGMATGELQKTLDRLIAHLAEHPQHYLDVRNDLERILADLPRGELGLRIESAWRALLRK